MKYSLAIIALLGMTQAIKIREEPAAAAAPAAAGTEMSELSGAPAAPAKAAAAPAPVDSANAKDAAPADGAAPAKAVDVKKDDGAAEKAAEPEKPKTKEKAVVAEALKTADDDAYEAVNKAGTKIDTTNAPEAIPQPAKKEGDAKPIPLSDSENTRNAVIRNATVGQEAIANNNNSVKEVTEKYDAKDAKNAEDKARAATEAALDKKAAEIAAGQEKAARNDTKDE